jgi:hypothetical protein
MFGGKFKPTLGSFEIDIGKMKKEREEMNEATIV